MRRHGDEDAYGDEDIVLEQSDDPIDAGRLRSQFENDVAINRTKMTCDSAYQQEMPDEGTQMFTQRTKSQLFRPKPNRFDDLL